MGKCVEMWAVKVLKGREWCWLSKHGITVSSGFSHVRLVGSRSECVLALEKEARYGGGNQDIRFVRIKRKPKAATVNAKKVVGWMFKTSSGGWAILQVYDESKRARLHGTDGECALSIRNVWTNEYHANNDCKASGLTGHVVPYYADGSVGE